jgi:hypothetical protein
MRVLLTGFAAWLVWAAVFCLALCAAARRGTPKLNGQCNLFPDPNEIRWRDARQPMIVGRDEGGKEEHKSALIS